jgi:uncharacterized protein (TIGR02284 family)
MHSNKQIDILNSLIEINNDRIKGYETASADLEDIDLKLIFGQNMQTSEKCKKELTQIVLEMGGVPLDDSVTMAIVHRAWIDFKAMLNGGDRMSILSSCAYGEEITVNVYKEVFITEINFLTDHTQTILKAQLLLLEADQAKVNDCIEILEKLD